MIILLLLIPLFWTGPRIPCPDCVEPIDNDTLILHSDCGNAEMYENMYFYRDQGYHVVRQNISDNTWTITMEKGK